MRVEIEHIEVLGDDHHGDGGGLKHGGLRDERHLVEYIGTAAYPAETVAGGEDLGEGAEVDHEILGVHRLECGQELALEAQLAVGVILDNGNLILVHDLHESLAALKRPCASAGVLEIGDDVDHLHVFGGGEDGSSSSIIMPPSSVGLRRTSADRA